MAVEKVDAAAVEPPDAVADAAAENAPAAIAAGAASNPMATAIVTTSSGKAPSSIHRNDNTNERWLIGSASWPP